MSVFDNIDCGTQRKAAAQEFARASGLLLFKIQPDRVIPDNPASRLVFKPASKNGYGTQMKYLAALVAIAREQGLNPSEEKRRDGLIYIAIQKQRFVKT